MPVSEGVQAVVGGVFCLSSPSACYGHLLVHGLSSFLWHSTFKEVRCNASNRADNNLSY